PEVGTLGARIRELREEAKVTQAELAEMLGVSGAIISLWENNVVTPVAKNFEALVGIFAQLADENWATSRNEVKGPALVLPTPVKVEVPVIPGAEPFEEIVRGESDEPFIPAPVEPKPPAVNHRREESDEGNDFQTMHRLLGDLEKRLDSAYADGFEAGS